MFIRGFPLAGSWDVFQLQNADENSSGSVQNSSKFSQKICQMFHLKRFERFVMFIFNCERQKNLGTCKKHFFCILVQKISVKLLQTVKHGGGNIML